mgnify:CR=1 FL=1
MRKLILMDHWVSRKWGVARFDLASLDTHGLNVRLTDLDVAARLKSAPARQGSRAGWR